MQIPLNFDPGELRYSGIIGTGGIGSGKIFKLNGNHTLGREESRSGHFLDINDYCKQHIILHYIKVLLGPSFSVIPVGKVGDDDIGKSLVLEMGTTGFIMNHVELLTSFSTLFSFCYYYPDGTGGNLTTDNSASAQVDADFIMKVRSDIKNLGSKGMIVAAPEVPLSARIKLLELGKENGAFCAASFTSEEIHSGLDEGLFAYTDLIAVNIDEAAAIAGFSAEESKVESIIDTAVKKLQIHNEDIQVSITMGKQGSWCWDGKTLNAFPAINAEAKSTAGAGDAFFSGLLCGMALDLELFEAQQLATLIAGLSVSSPHTINKEIDRQSLKRFLHSSDIIFSEKIISLLEE